MWPHYDVAEANNPNFSWHLPGTGARIPGTFKPLFAARDTPWANLAAGRQVTIFQCGNNETHTGDAVSTTNLNDSNIHAVASALQANSPSVIPIVAVGGVAVGTAPGGFQPAGVGNADGIVGLFNSAASRAGGLLSRAGDASLYKAHYDAFSQLNRAANRSTTKTSYQTASSAAQFLGTNLAAKLQITPDDLVRYGVTGGTPANVAAIARTMIVAVKAFKMGLTNSVVMRAFNDDPHGAFDGGAVMTRAPMHAKVYQAFMDDLTTNVDDNTLQSLADSTVITMAGDTTKAPCNKNGWGDGTPNNSNVVYVYSAGHLKSGWFGGTTRNNVAMGFDATGATAAYNGAATARFATASIAYAIAKRDERLISTFANGTTVSNVFGNPKDT
jgi:predicted RNA-binding Zn ribbon-like protein